MKSLNLCKCFIQFNIKMVNNQCNLMQQMKNHHLYVLILSKFLLSD